MCPTGDVEGFDEDDEVSEKKFAWTLIMEHNHKKKKSDSFQSMGMTDYTHTHIHTHTQKTVSESIHVEIMFVVT